MPVYPGAIQTESPLHEHVTITVLILPIVLAILLVSQIYWAIRGLKLARRRIRSRGLRLAVCGAVLAFYLLAFAYYTGRIGGRSTPVTLTPPDALLSAPLAWWIASSLVAFLVVLLLAVPKGIAAAVRKLRSRFGGGAIESPARRQFLARTAAIATGAPFVAGAYGLLYGRLNLETTSPRIHLPRLPAAFDGFRVCQLSDIHIGPFMPAGEIRKYVAIANRLKPDLIVLTGDFVTFDPGTQYAVVEALAGLRAPFGVFGSLGNHDAWAGVESSITELFRRVGFRILRGEAVPIRSHGEELNLIGVDFQSARRFGPSAPVKHPLAEHRAAGGEGPREYSAEPQPGHVRPRGGAGDRSEPGGTHPRRAGGAGVYQPGNRAQPPGDALRGGLVSASRAASSTSTAVSAPSACRSASARRRKSRCINLRARGEARGRKPGVQNERGAAALDLSTAVG